MSNSRLLLADDSVTIQKVVNLTFADEGYEVIAVSDGDSALEKAYQFAPDLILADVNMPGLTGYQLCERIKNSPDLGHIPVILLVGSFEPFDESEARRVRADDVLTKPFHSIRELVSKVNELLGSKRPVEKATAAGGSFVGGFQRVTDAEPAFDRGRIEMDDSRYEVATETESPLDLADDEAEGLERFVSSRQDVEYHEDILSTEHQFASTTSEEFMESGEDTSYEIDSEETPSLSAVGEDFRPSEPPATDYLFDDEELLELPVIEDDESEDEDYVEGYDGEEAERDVEEEYSREPIHEHAGTEMEHEQHEASPPALEQVYSEHEFDEEVKPVEHQIAALSASETRETVDEMLSSENFSPEMIDAIARRVVERLSDRVVREIAWEVVPPLAESAVEKMTREKMK